MKLRSLAIGIALTVSAAAAGQQPGVQLYAAGSLRAPMTEIVQAFTASGGPAVNATYGASGLLRERIEKGEPADVFASADVGNPQALARAGRAAAPVVFARNRLVRARRAGRGRRPRIRCSSACSIRRSSWVHRPPRLTRPATTHGRCSRRPNSCAPVRSRRSMPRR